jgi:hypothetical protein
MEELIAIFLAVYDLMNRSWELDARFALYGEETGEVRLRAIIKFYG